MKIYAINELPLSTPAHVISPELVLIRIRGLIGASPYRLRFPGLHPHFCESVLYLYLLTT